MPEITKKMKSLGIRVYAIGLGTISGAPISSGDQSASHVVDSSGEIVITRLQEKNLKGLADATGGLYYQVTDTDNELGLILQHIRQLEKKEFKDVHIVEKEDQFQLFLLLVLILLVIEYLLPERKKNEKS
jgi:Ca-activated chloride channel family protein